MDISGTKTPFGSTDNSKFYRWAVIIALVLLAMAVLPRFFSATIANSTKVSKQVVNGAANVISAPGKAIETERYVEFLKNSPEIQSMLVINDDTPRYEVVVAKDDQEEVGNFTIHVTKQGLARDITGTIRKTSSGFELANPIYFDGQAQYLETIREAMPKP